MHARMIAMASAFLASIGLYAAEPVAVKMQKGAQGNYVIAFNLDARNVAWETKPCTELNFVRTTSAGILVACEESIVLMLNPQTGKEIWRRNLSIDQPVAVSGGRRVRGKYDMNHFLAEKPEGFLLSADSEDYFLIGRDGRYLIRCDQTCGDILKSAPLYAGKLIVRWRNPGTSRSIVAFDVAAGKMAWEMNSCRTANFAIPTSAGVVIGCDDASLLLLDTTTGKEVWRRDLSTAEPDDVHRTKLRVNRFHAETSDGFLVSSADTVYMFVSRKGDYTMRCDQESCRSLASRQ